jgi:hypothetical protein
MKVFYISHPYTGAEKSNREDAEKITRELAAAYPQYVFINPLDLMRSQENAELDYEDILFQTIEILRRCNGVIMTGNWTESNGCIKEIQAALNDKKYIYDIEHFKKMNK